MSHETTEVKKSFQFNSQQMLYKKHEEKYFSFPALHVFVLTACWMSDRRYLLGRHLSVNVQN